MDELLHFPEKFPLTALGVLAPIVRTGKVEDKVEAGEAALTLLAYGMGQYLGHEHEGERLVGAVNPVGGRAAGKRDVVSALEELEAHAGSEHVVGGPHVVGKFNAKKFAENAIKIARFVLPLILGI